MADKKITALTALTSLSSDDLLVAVDDPGGSPETKKITWANLLSSLYGTANVFTTNTTTTLLTLGHNSSGTPAASFGGAIVGQLESDTTANQDAFKIRWEWTTATHASRSSKMTISNIRSGSFVDVLSIDSNGCVGIGSAANENRMTYINKIFASATTSYGLYVDARNTAGSIYGAQYVVRQQDYVGTTSIGMQCGVEAYANTANATISSTAIGLQGRVQVNAKAGYTASITGVAAAIAALSPTFSAGGGTEVIEDEVGVYIYNQGAAGVTTTATGLYIANQSGSPVNMAIITNAGDITFNAGLADAADFLLNGTTYALIQTDASDNELYLCANAAAKFSIFGAPAVARHAHIADATDAGTVITVANHILSVLEEYGFLASS
jgi:hypothetical protein